MAVDTANRSHEFLTFTFDDEGTRCVLATNPVVDPELAVVASPTRREDEIPRRQLEITGCF
jgi:hypothetical protein